MHVKKRKKKLTNNILKVFFITFKQTTPPHKSQWCVVEEFKYQQDEFCVRFKLI